MAMHSMEQVKHQVIELCNICGYNDDKIITNCFQKIEEYLSYNGSSIDMVFDSLQSSINNKSWMLGWQRISQETDKLSGKYYEEQLKTKEKKEKMLLDYVPISIGDEILDEKQLLDININLGVIDNFGVFHTSERVGIAKTEWPDHRELADYLRLKEKIKEYYIRVGCICGINDGILCAESLYYGYQESLKNFLLTEKMAVALYNAIMSKKDYQFTTFEEKLAYYGTEFGYYSTKYNIVPQIYDNELYHNNMKVLSYTLGKRFDSSFFTDILKK